MGDALGTTSLSGMRAVYSRTSDGQTHVVETADKRVITNLVPGSKRLGTYERYTVCDISVVAGRIGCRVAVCDVQNEVTKVFDRTNTGLSVEVGCQSPTKVKDNQLNGLDLVIVVERECTSLDQGVGVDDDTVYPCVKHHVYANEDFVSGGEELGDVDCVDLGNTSPNRAVEVLYHSISVVEGTKRIDTTSSVRGHESEDTTSQLTRNELADDSSRGWPNQVLVNSVHNGGEKSIASIGVDVVNSIRILDTVRITTQPVNTVRGRAVALA